MNSGKAASAETVLSNQAHAPESFPLKSALLGLAGASIEWYDFLLYSTAAALVFPVVFFPATLPPFVALIASFGTFAVGFLARPLGAAVFGHMGDHVGRKEALAAALIVMGTATTLIALLPTYHTAGVLAPLALTTLRFLQGLAVGGQWGGATLLATENAPRSHRGLYGSIAQAGVPVGLVLANLVFLAASGAMAPAAFMAYGWRIPFLFSIALVCLGLFMHFRVEETVAFRKLRKQDAVSWRDSVMQAQTDTPSSTVSRPLGHRSQPVFEALRHCPGKIFLAAGAYLSTNASFYIFNSYLVAYGTTSAGLKLPRSTMLGAVLIAQAVSAAALLLAGACSDRYGRRPIFIMGVALTGAWGFILFPLIETRSFVWIAVALTVPTIFNSMTFGSLAALYAELFETRVRYSGISLAYQFGAMAGGGLAPIIATTLYAEFHSDLWISAYIAASCLISLVCASRLQETVGTDLETAGSVTVTAVSST